MTDTIFALSTPPGKSGVAVIRVSGPEALGALAALGCTAPEPRKAILAELQHEGAVLDKALILYFPAPHSFTGEAIVECHVHGSRAIVKRLLEILGALQGFRPAEPGEFTRRAFANGKMDLTAAEGLADLIDAETEAQRRQAVRFMQGEAARFYGHLRAEILESLALTEAYIDFPEEEIPVLVLQQTRDKVAVIQKLIQKQLEDKGAAERVRDGVQVAILGAPNAGKSSLMNLLARRDVAIVSETAGTTRDVIEVHLDIAGYAVVIADTAGLRETTDAVEREGIRRSFVRSEAADIRILVLDATMEITTAGVEQVIDLNTIILINKSDITKSEPVDSESAALIQGLKSIIFSTYTQVGVEELMAELSQRIASISCTESSVVARSRHRHQLTEAEKHLQYYLQHPEAPLELGCEELRRAAVEIGKITGAVSPDEVLEHIFSRFCIGK